MKVFDRGSALIVQFTTKKLVPFVGSNLEDVSNPKVFITDPTGVVKVNGATPEHSSDGKYYYAVQSDETWKPGVYEIKITASISTDEDVTKKLDGFKLR